MDIGQLESDSSGSGLDVFTRNDPYDRDAALQLVVPQKMESRRYMQSIGDYRVPADAQMIRPRVVVPCHYDMMINNISAPEMLRVALDQVGSDADCFVMKYYEPWLYRRH